MKILAKHPEASKALVTLFNASQKAKTNPAEFNAAFKTLEDAVEKLNKEQAITSDEYKLIRNLYNGQLKESLH